MKYASSIALLFWCSAGFAQVPEYTNLKFWAAHPDKEDASDWTNPDQKKSTIDVFYIYPTIYLNPKFSSFSADINDEVLNKEIEETAIKNQASVFNGLANVYAPFYRQMHYQGYFVQDSTEKSKAKEAFDTAYADVLHAFEYYLAHENKGKAFVVAGHSQGTNHAERLLKERILPDSSVKKQIVLAYLVGMPIVNEFSNFAPCTTPTETGCFVSWRTFNKDFTPEVIGDSIVCTNPITFLPSGENSTDEHLGVLFPNGKLKAKKSIIAEVSEGYLAIELTKFPFKQLYDWDNYHKADYNLFWLNMRNNFEQRITHFSAKD